VSIVKSFSVGNGDMFYIRHNSDNFTVIDCCYDTEDNWEQQLAEIKRLSKSKGITRFISTHPDDDHIRGLCDYVDEIGIVNFYCVNNEATKDDASDDFDKYCSLRDDSKKAFYLYKGCTRRWMNLDNEERDHAGIHCLWPDTSNADYKAALKDAKNGESPNNISPILTNSVEKKKFMWMGDIEGDFLEKIKDSINFPDVTVLFAPHHGRDSGKIPKDILKKLNPKLIVIGEAPSKNLNYYEDYNTITQNSAGDIVFEPDTSGVNIYVGEKKYSVDYLDDDDCSDAYDCFYIGTLTSN